MQAYLYSIFSVFAGFLIVYLFKPNNQQNLKLLLAFSGAFLLSTTVFNLIPEVFEDHQGKEIGIWIMSGILLQKVLEYFSKGAEHGHFHIKESNKKVPFLILISLSIHAILEGFPIHRHADNVLVGIIVHKIPVAMILTTFLIRSKLKRSTIIILLSSFSIMTPIGTLLASNFKTLEVFHHEINALVIGIFLHVSTTILFESNTNHKFNISKLIVILAATTIAYFI